MTNPLRITPELPHRAEVPRPQIVRLRPVTEEEAAKIFNPLLDTSEAARQRRRRSMAGGLGLNMLLWTAVGAALTMTPATQRFIVDAKRVFWTAPADTPVPPYKPKAIVRPLVQPRPEVLAKVTPPPEVVKAPEVKTPPPAPVIAPPEVQVKQPTFAVAELRTPPVPAPVVRRIEHPVGFDVQSAAAPAVPKTEGPKLGSFGSADGVATNAYANAKANVPHLGTFGAAGGTGEGGAVVGKHVITTGGFGAEDACCSGTGTGHGKRQATIAATSFGAATVGPSPTAHKNNVDAVPATRPPEILYKPKPVYTEVARQKRIEGEVVLKVLLAASGDIQILSVEQGLGYGLDEAAEQAARHIRFRPAQQSGQPVDMPVLVHITFSLAY